MIIFIQNGIWVLPQENEEDYKQASPNSFAKNLRGNLLYMHGTGDDNVHYKNAEALINELVKNGKVFQLMAYPNRTHGIFEGTGTSQHLNATFIKFPETKLSAGGEVKNTDEAFYPSKK